MTQVNNLDIKDLILILSKMSLKYEFCNISCDSERNSINIIPVKDVPSRQEEGVSPEELV